METASTPEAPPPPPPPSVEEPYPVNLEAERQAEYNRFLPLVKWLLAFPHYIVLIFLTIGVVVVKVIAFFAILFTARYPEGLYNYVRGVFQWAWRVGAYVYLLSDRYPPFKLGEDPDYPARLSIVYPEQVDRWRPLVQWLLVLPYAIVAGVLMYLAMAVAFIGVFVILFTKNLPEGMFNLIVNPFRWQARANTYGYYMVKRYPPFEWD